MLKSEKSISTEETKIDIQELTELIQKLPEKEKERFFFMLKGAELVSAGV